MVVQEVATVCFYFLLQYLRRIEIVVLKVNSIRVWEENRANYLTIRAMVGRKCAAACLDPLLQYFECVEILTLISRAAAG